MKSPEPASPSASKRLPRAAAKTKAALRKGVQ